MLGVFPTFNFYGSSLLILSLQGLIFGVLIFTRYLKEKNLSDLLLAIVLFITCYHQTAYTIGFLGWYDTYRTTKINYYLVNLSLILAPFIFFYIKSILSASFKFRRQHIWHFIPGVIFIITKVIILLYDRLQPGFDDVQNGPLVVSFQWKYLDPIVFFISTLQMLLYLAFSFQLLYLFRDKVRSYFSNTYKLELRWLQTFLIAYSILYLFNSFQTVINSMIVDLSWTQEWWYYLLSGISIIYVGVKGYYTDLSELKSVDFASFQIEAKEEKQQKLSVSEDLIDRKEKLTSFINENKSYLNPNLTLNSLADELGTSREELSETVNQGFNSRFNDFINHYRVKATKQMIDEGKHERLSLLGLAYEAGFNSKATFNRAFKKEEKVSPSEYLNSL